MEQGLTLQIRPNDNALWPAEQGVNPHVCMRLRPPSLRVRGQVALKEGQRVLVKQDKADARKLVVEGRWRFGGG